MGPMSPIFATCGRLFLDPDRSVPSFTSSHPAEACNELWGASLCRVRGRSTPVSLHEPHAR